MTTSLAVIETMQPAELFKPGTLDPILDRIKAEVRREAACLDISTEANRKALASLAFKVAKSKTFLEARGKELVSAEKERLKVVDKERGRVWDELEALQAEVRKPLTDWENADKDRVARHEAKVQTIVDAGILAAQGGLSIEAMEDSLKAIQTMEYDWEEFIQRAGAAARVTVGQIKDAIAKRKHHDAEQKELAELRAAQAQREQEARDAAIAQKAKDEAEAAAKRREEERAREAEAERARIEQERIQAEARAKQAEAQRVLAEEKARKDAEDAATRLRAEQARAKAAAEQAERDKAAAKAAEERRTKLAAEERQKAIEDERERAALAARDAAAAAEASRKAAVEAERARAAEEKRKADAETAKREANRKHAAKINCEVRDALVIQCGLDRERATRVVETLASNTIPHTKISY